MTATAPNPGTSRKRSPLVGERIELARYTLPDGTVRLIVGQRVDGVVRVTDVPQTPGGRAYLVERGIEQDGYGALQALVADYLAQTAVLKAIPIATAPVERYLAHLDSACD